MADTCGNCGRLPEPDERHQLSVSDGGEGAMLVCLDPEGYELLHEASRCTCHGTYLCPEPPDPPF
jgi:hypothetical protein